MGYPDWKPSEDDPVSTDIEKRHHIAAEIGTYPAEVESTDTYEERIGDYKARGFTYIPLPADKKYYDVDEGWIKKLNINQIIAETTHLKEVLRLLQEEPFLLIDRVPYIVSAMPAGAVSIYTDNEEPTLLYPEEHRNESYTSADNTACLGDVLSEGDLTTEVRSRDDIEVYGIEEAKEELQSLSDAIDSMIMAGLDDEEDRYGIITLADVNRRGVKIMLYVVFSGLVSKLARKIEREYPDSESIFKYLRAETIGRWHKNRMKGLEIHVAEQMNMLELMQVIQASDKEFVKECGFSLKSDVEKLNSINEIRNKVMHANKSLIYDRRDIQEVLTAIEEAQDIASDIE